MVSKIAVIALVAIVACPILLGYALNLNETTVTEYKANDDAVNVTQLLQNGTDWNYTYGDPYQLNDATSSVFENDYNFSIFPFYNKISKQKTTTRLYGGELNNFHGGTETSIQKLEKYQISFDYNATASNYVQATGYVGGTQVFTSNNVSFLSWDASTDTVSIGVKWNANSEYFGQGTYTGLTSVSFTLVNLPSVYGYYIAVPKDGEDLGGYQNYYADISDGYYFKKMCNQPRVNGWDINLPNNTTNVLLSVNLDSITDSSYIFYIEELKFEKTTTAGVVSWTVTSNSITKDLYYDPNRSNNTYQILITDTGDDGTHYTGHAQLRYIGSWQKIIGEANYYQTYDLDYRMWHGNDSSTLESIKLQASRTPTIRIDAAKFAAFEYPVIENNTYDPAVFKGNPSTTISNITQYGDQIIFGGNTYDVTDGYIMIGSHKVSLNGIVFRSVPNDYTLDYDNYIGNTLISSTADPSTIQFVGKWSASVSTASSDIATYTKTEWNVGEFGWDGIDQNFLMVGLITCLGVFIALGIYARKSRSGGIIPLMIVTGCAAAVFFIML